MGSGAEFAGIIDVVHMRARHLEGGSPVEEDIPEEYRAAADEARSQLV
jgi:elongation factor G